MYSIFVSDLHLCPTRAHINRIFFEFLRGPAAAAQALYILGDLFEYWAGDDDDDAFSASVLSALRELSDSRISLYVMHGNRDFLIGDQFALRSGAQLLPDPTFLTLYGSPTLLMHGDSLCTDDVDYQQFRVHARDSRWQREFLSRSLTSRKAEIAGLRRASETSKKAKPQAIMDVAPGAVESAFREYAYPRLIHGHTHRPARHTHIVDGHVCERWVLRDWYQAGDYLRVSQAGCEAVTLAAA